MLPSAPVNLILDSYLVFSAGYGYAAIQLAAALNDLPNLNLIIPANTRHVEQELPEQVRAKIKTHIQSFRHYKRIIFRTPPPVMDENWPRNLLYWYTSWETTNIPTGWTEVLNEHVLKLFVPTTRQVNIFREGGIEIPISVVPHGINPWHYPYVIRPLERNTYTFGFYATWLDHRKGVDILVKAFTREFPAAKYPNVYLRLKGRGEFNWPRSGNLDVSDERIGIEQKTTSVAENLMFLQELDCFVFPTRGEGFGLPALEAMSSGLPVIATNWSGPEDYMKLEYSFPLQYTMGNVNIQSRNPLYIYTGNWAEPNIEHLQYLMKYCYENRQTVRNVGESAAKYVVDNWTWNLAAKKLVASL